MIINSDRAGDGPSALPAGDGGRVPVVEPGSVEAEFAEAPGALVQRRWVQAAAAVRFEHLVPVADFPVVPGRRWGPGWWWSATTGGHVMHGSQAMCTQLMLLDRDPQVVGLSARPVRLIWRDAGSGRVLTWVPQVFARYADGRALLADCPSGTEPAGDRAARAAAVLGAACAAVGFTYRRLVPPAKVVASNVRWLAGYRHPRYRDAGGLEQAVLEACAAPRPLMAGAAAAGEVLSALPVLYHALWSGRLTADLTRPLGEHTVVCSGTVTAGVEREQQAR
ncbi:MULTISPECIES: TnsA-like heteromeric transposase endonuclease subunit [unclassified Streptomyces]|uniref:TnsA-like heteromeric transposase endonuclease subunit n=1 Tax=unclassified Streptomyces TaxID=2593676 RepID=UPI000B86DEBC|nr:MULTISPECIES: TnsA-like heteromeric transposase endonuclease subunit [unclassified Streptomyces]MYR75216.1 TnsA-like heteromeric transposase endonuclease subunit [Streptomyces sp. SID4925]